MDRDVATRLVEDHSSDSPPRADKDVDVRRPCYVEGLAAAGHGPGRWHRLRAVPLIAAGLAATVVASVGLLTHEPSGRGRAAAPPGARTTLAVSGAGPMLDNAADVSVERMTYQPRQASSWHRHPGLHAVEVLSGALTIYDANCQAHTYGPGESYVGGTTEHRARNATDDPLEMVVTDILPLGTSMAEFVVALPPPPCAVSAS